MKIKYRIGSKPFELAEIKEETLTNYQRATLKNAITMLSNNIYENIMMKNPNRDSEFEINIEEVRFSN